MSTGKNFHGFSLNHKSFPVNHGLDQQHKFTKCYNEGFTTHSHFHSKVKTRKISATDVFPYMV